MANPQVLILGQDLIELGYVIKYPPVSEMRSFQNDKLITNVDEIEVNNEDDFFSINNPASIFKDINWLYTPIQRKDSNGIVTWDGNLISVPRNHTNKTAILRSKNSMYQFRNEAIDYHSSTFETAADAFKNICDDVGFTNYNMKAVEDSIAQLTANSCKVMVNINTSDGLTFQQVCEKLGEYSNSDVYNHANDIYFVHWQPYAGGASITLNESDLKKLPSVIEDESELINDYNIGYDGDFGIPATDSNSNNIGSVSRDRFGTKSLAEMRSGTDGQIVFETKAAAIYIGEGYIKRTTKNYNTIPSPLSKISFEIFADNKNYINLQTKFRLNLSDEGWTNKIFEVFEFTVDEDNDSIVITAYEVVV